MALEGTVVWIFGYGSLLWKTNFPYEEMVVGHVKGYGRRFWQGSVVHRGTSKAAGRVVTLVQIAEECTWGIAYKVDPKDVPGVMTYLNQRETSSYHIHQIMFHPATNYKPQEPFTVLTYIGTEAHPNYLGPASVESIAQQIVGSHGESGSNADYVLQLAEVTRTIVPQVQDQHLYDLEDKVKSLLEQEGKTKHTTMEKEH